MKKLTSILLALIITLSLASCKSSDEEKNSSDTKFTPSTVDVDTSDTDDAKEDDFTTDKETHDDTAKDSTKEETTESNVISNPDTSDANTGKTDIGAGVAPFVGSDTSYSVDSVSIKPAYVYWEDGKLIAQCYVINGFNYNVYNIEVKELTFSNGDGVIASGAGFGVCEGLTLAPFTYATWTFTFSGDSVINYGANLSHLFWSTSINNSY